MARKDLRTLYQRLLETEFRFMPRGTQHINEIYDEVEQRFTELCDDNYLCSENCSSGHHQPEWKHTVRKALDRLKRISMLVSKDRSHGYWEFR
jgi:hypothetical protein